MTSIPLSLDRPTTRFESTRSAPWTRWSVLTVLLVAELGLLMFRFSMDGMSEVDGWEVWIFHNAQRIFHLVAGIGAPALLFGGPIFLNGWRNLEYRSYSTPLTTRLMLGNLAAFAAHYWLTGRIVEGGALSSPQSLAWFAAWVATGLAVVSLWSVAVVPLELWKALAGRFVGALAIGAVVYGLVLLASWQTRDFWWNPLRYPTFWAVNALLSPFCPQIICQPEKFTLGTPEFTAEIMPMCSGYEGIGLIWVFSAAFLILNRRTLRFPQALLLIPLGTLAIWVANAVRIAVLILIGSWYSPEVAEGTFHSLAGWTALNAVAIGVMLLSQRLSLFRVAAKADPEVAVAVPAAIENPTPPYLAPVLSLIAASMIAGGFAVNGFDKYYPACVAVTFAALWLFRRQYAAMGPWSWSWVAFGVGVLTFAGWMALEPFYPVTPGADTATPTALAAMGRPAALAWLVLRILGSVVTVPLAEELAFRGFLTRRLISANFQDVTPGQFTWISFLGSSIAFGFLHQRWLAGTLAGMAFALVYYRRGRISDAVLAHATANALIAVWVLTTGDWSTWS